MAGPANPQTVANLRNRWQILNIQSWWYPSFKRPAGQQPEVQSRSQNKQLFLRTDYQEQEGRPRGRTKSEV